ncbi:MAG: nicotinate-nucleotide--dimethylbenzimidazole phosphoribosyltransferase [Alphaproteobacteria bacterium]
MNQPVQKPSPAISFDEIRQLVKNDLPVLQSIIAPPALLDEMGVIWSWLASSQGREKPLLRHPRLALFATAAAENILKDIQQGKHPLNPLAEEANADLQVYELGSRHAQPDDNEIAHALAYGMMAVQPGIDLLILAALDPAAEKAGDELVARLNNTEPLAAIKTLDIAAMTGALVAARLAKTPVLLEGKAALAAASVLEKLNTGAGAHAKDIAAIPFAKTALPLPCRAAMLVPFLKTVTKI